MEKKWAALSGLLSEKESAAVLALAWEGEFW
jgi:hypothetical protein